MASELSAIERILRTIPDEIRFRFRGERAETNPEKPKPRPVATEPTQPSLFAMEKSQHGQ